MGQTQHVSAVPFSASVWNSALFFVRQCSCYWPDRGPHLDNLCCGTVIARRFMLQIIIYDNEKEILHWPLTLTKRTNSVSVNSGYMSKHWEMMELHLPWQPGAGEHCSTQLAKYLPANGKRFYILALLYTLRNDRPTDKPPNGIIKRQSWGILFNHRTHSWNWTEHYAF